MHPYDQEDTWTGHSTMVHEIHHQLQGQASIQYIHLDKAQHRGGGDTPSTSYRAILVYIHWTEHSTMVEEIHHHAATGPGYSTYILVPVLSKKLLNVAFNLTALMRVMASCHRVITVIEVQRLVV